MTLTERAHLSATQGMGPSGQPKGERGERACAPEQGRPVSWAARSALGHGKRGGWKLGYMRGKAQWNKTRERGR